MNLLPQKISEQLRLETDIAYSRKWEKYRVKLKAWMQKSVDSCASYASQGHSECYLNLYFPKVFNPKSVVEVLESYSATTGIAIEVVPYFQYGYGGYSLFGYKCLHFKFSW
jgi:hypothetical protein